MHTKKCSLCQFFKPLAGFTHDRTQPDGRHHRCLACERLRSKIRQQNGSLPRANEEWRKRNPQAVEAHKIMRDAIRRGELKREPCLVCGEANTHGHHESYDKPLTVIWFCPTHHHEHHRLERLYGLGQFLFDFFKEGAV